MSGAEAISRARAYAQALHRNDRRKATEESYFSGHLEPVARLVADAGGDSVQIAAAYLHDAAEDHGGLRQLHLIREQFGDEVAQIVADLSDSLVDLDAGELKAPWHERKLQYLESLTIKPARSLEVSAADKLHNATSIVADHAAMGDALWDRFTTKSGPDQRWYYESLTATLRARIPHWPLTGRLAEVVARFP
jgi:(p)ppGpp synthase/HD superfamily hydrolase